MPIAQNTDEIGRAESLTARLSRQRWIIAAVVCLLIAAAVLLLGRMDAAFVVATLGVLAWFWNERNRLRPQGIENVDEFEDEDEAIEDGDEK